MSEYMRSLREAVGPRLLLVPGVAAVIRDDRGRLLLQLRAEDGRWSLPAGAIDPGESPADAVVREVYEETGLEVEPVRLLGVFGGERGFRHRYPGGEEAEFTVVVFECEARGGRLRGVDGETAELRYFAVDDLPPLNASYPRELFLARRGGEALFQPPVRRPRAAASDRGRRARH